MTDLWDPILVTVRLAVYTTAILLALGLPLAWWLARTHSRWKVVVEAVTALPLVLPPTVLGFYLLLFMGAQGELGQAWQALFGQPLAFSFAGLVVASCIYSLPFVVQPLQAAFEALPRHALEAAWTLGASRWRAFWRIALPASRRGFLTAAVLGFAHTLGEFGVVLMVGGNLPGETRVLSIALFEHVEALEYDLAHRLSLGLLVVSFLVLAVVYGANRRWPVGGAR